MTRRSRAAAPAATAAAARAATTTTTTAATSAISTVDGRAQRRLIAGARTARQHAYARYSGFQVGAAVLDDRGRIHLGCNVENASYGLTICAERNAVAAAIVAGARRITAVAVVASGAGVTPPCGACRQVLAEIGTDELLVLLAGPRGAVSARTLRALLPEPFRL